MNGSFNKDKSIEHMVEVNIYYQGYKEKMEIVMINASWRQHEHGQSV